MRYLTRSEICARLGISTRTFERYGSSGWLDSFGHRTAGGHWRIAEEEVDRLKAWLSKPRSQRSPLGPAHPDPPERIKPTAQEWVRRKLAVVRMRDEWRRQTRARNGDKQK